MASSRTGSSVWSVRPASATPAPMTTTDALYVYGVVPKGTPPGVFANAGAEVELVESGDLAAITRRVPLAEYGEEALPENLKNPVWLEGNGKAHHGMLGA